MNVIEPKVVRYPGVFPLPEARAYSGDIDYGVSHQELAVGFTSLSRRYGSNPTTLNLRFLIPVLDYRGWAAWIGRYAIESWIVMPVIDQYSGWGQIINDQIVRFQSPITSRPVGFQYSDVHALVDVLPQDIASPEFGVGNDIEPYSRWVNAGTAGNPSPDWIDGGTAPNPSPDNIDAETPADHS